MMIPSSQLKRVYQISKYPHGVAVSGRHPEVVFRRLMDNANTKRKVSSSVGRRGWTNEKHLRFLSFIEASFVRTLYETNGHPEIRLDSRDSPESTATFEEVTSDLRVDERPRRYSASSSADQYFFAVRVVGVGETSSRTDKRNKKSCLNDQVVPQLEKGDKEGEKEFA